MSSRNYQRKYLRAPFREEILFAADNYIFKAKGLNISEGGVLLESINHFPGATNLPFMIQLPQFPLFKNFRLKDIVNFSPDRYPGKIARFSASLVRKVKIESPVEGVISSQIGLKFSEIGEFDRAKVSHYVETYASNLIYLQVLLDTYTDDPNDLNRLRLIAEYLGYEKNTKLSLLRKNIHDDYRSLQWL